MLLKFEITKRQKEKIERIIRNFEKNEDYYSFNFIGLFGVIVNKPIEKESTYFCSQFVSEVLKRAGIRLWDKPTSLVTPNDFRSIPHVFKIYEGKLYEFGPVKTKCANNPHIIPSRSMKEDFIIPFDKSFRARIYKDTSFSLRHRYLSPIKMEVKTIFSLFL